MKKYQSEKITYCMVPFIQHLLNDNILEMEDRLVAISSCWGLEVGGHVGVAIKGPQEDMS